MIGISTAHFAFDGLESAFIRCEKIGFGLIEIFTWQLTQEQILNISQLSRRFNIKVSYHAPYRGNYDLGMTDEKISEELLIRSIDATSSLGGRYLIYHVGRYNMDIIRGRQMALSRVVKTISQSLSFLEKKHIHLCLEDNTKCHYPDPLGDCIQDFEFIFDSVNSPYVGMTIDFGHANVTGNIFKYLQKFRHKIFYSHINDNDSHDDQHIAPGQGTIDWNKVANACKQIGFKGPFCFEFNEKYISTASKHIKNLIEV